MRTRRRFEILWESRLGAWAEDLGAIFARAPRTAGDAWSMRSFPFLKNRGPLVPARGLLASLLVHTGAFVLLSHASMAARVEPVVAAAARDDAPIYLDLRALKELKILRALPVVTPPGPGGAPGVPGRPTVAPRPATQDPPQASTATSPKFTIIVNPLKAESRTQVIRQSMAPPDLSINVDQEVPDIVMADGPAAPKPQADLQLHQPVARDPVLDSQAGAAPAIPSDAPQLPIKIAASVPQPKMPTAYFTSDSMHPVARVPVPDSPAAAAPAIPSDAPQLPIKIAASVPQPKMPTAYFTSDSLHPVARAPLRDSPAAAAPAIPSDAPQSAIKIAASAPQPKMPAAYFTSDSLHAPHDAGGAAARKDASADPSPDAAGGIVVMSAQPAPFSQLATLAQGNRYGAIAIAPSKPGPGSPGGKPNSAGAPAPSGAGAGGDTSVGVGAGKSGGGGGPGPEAPGRASFSAVGGSGTSGGMDANGLLAPVLPAAVFPVIIAPKLRHAPLVISAGPMGGGCLDVYGALTCGKVYSIFLAMPGKNWALQYCAHEASGAPPATAAPATTGVVQMQAGIVPPSPEQQFDFRRLPVPDKDGDKLIILQGMIAADGSVGSVRVFRGVLPEMDAEAAQAFGKWKFKPATRAGAAVALDVLVGVPARQPESASATPSGVEISR